MLILRNLLNPLKLSYCVKFQFRRLLMCDETLGLRRFRKNCEKIQGKLLASNENVFKNTEGIKDEEIGLRVLDMIHVAQNDEQVEQCVELFKRYLATTHKMTHGKGSNKDDLFQFGPLFMRMLHNLKNKDIAIQLMEDQELTNELHTPSVALIYMDLLYKVGSYTTVVEFYEDSFIEFFNKAREEKMRVGMKLFDMNHTTLVMAALYKLNTPGSLNKAVQLVKEKHHDGNESLSNRTRAYAAALALKQESPVIAFDILNLESEGNMPVFNICLQIIIWSHLDRPDEALILLKFFTTNKVENRGMFVFPDCLEALEKSISRCGCAELRKTYDEYVAYLTEKSSIGSTSLFDSLDGIMFNSKKGARRYRYKRLEDNVSSRDNTIRKKKTGDSENVLTRRLVGSLRNLRFRLQQDSTHVKDIAVKKSSRIMTKIPSLKEDS